MTHKRILTIIAILLIASFLVNSCAQQSDTSQDSVKDKDSTTEPQETEDPNPAPELPDQKFDGYEFIILGRPSTPYISYREQFFDAESENGEPVNDAVYRRNSSAEEKFNIVISHLEAEKVGEMARKIITAGDGEFDVL